MRRHKMKLGRYDHAASLTFFAYAAGSIIVPVSLVELSQDLGFSLELGGMAAGGALQLGRTIPMVLAMLIIGFVAGRWGNRSSLGYSIFVMSVGIAICAIAPGYGVLFFAMVLAGIGEGVIEGLATPFVKSLHPEEHGRYINVTQSFWSVGVLVTVLLSGWLLSIGVSWRLLVGGIALVGCVAAFMILLPTKRGHRAVPHQRVAPRKVLKNIGQIVRNRSFWRYYAAMFLAGGGEFCLTFWSASHIRLYYGGEAWVGAAGVALFAFAMVIGRVACGYFVSQERLRFLLIVAAFGGTIVCGLLPFSPNVWIFGSLLFVAGLATAPFWPSIQSYAADKLPALDSTMLLILLSCAGVPGCGVFTYVMGVIGDQSGSLSVAFFLVPIAFLGIAGLLVSERKLS